MVRGIHRTRSTRSRERGHTPGGGHLWEGGYMNMVRRLHGAGIKQKMDRGDRRGGVTHKQGTHPEKRRITERGTHLEWGHIRRWGGDIYGKVIKRAGR